MADYDPTEYIYDATTGLLDEVKYTSGIDVKSAFYEYDGAARLTKIRDWIDGVNGIQYAYDDASRVTSITDYDGSVLSYTYDNAGNVASMNDYHGNTTSYTYTATNQVDTLTAPGSKVWNWDYNLNSQPTQYTHPNGMVTAYGYDPLDNRLTSIDHKDSTTVVQGFAYAFDASGNITSVTHEDGSSWTYTYDGKNRLSDAIRKDTLGVEEYREAYTYDAGDNMLTKAVTPAGQATVTTTSTVNNANELLSMADGTTTTNFVYDDWGRQTSKADGTSTATYAYHYGTKMTSVTSNFPTEGNVTYEYGADGKRRERVSGSDYTWYNWDVGFTVVSEEDNAGALTRSYVNRDGRAAIPATGFLTANVPIIQTPVGNIIAEVLGNNPATGAARYYMQNHLNSTRSAYDAAKASIGKVEFTPFGETYTDTLPSDLTRRYTGLDLDSATGKYFAPYRYYDPKQAGWTTRDPLGMVDGPNTYAYVIARPTVDTDALGLFTKQACRAACEGLRKAKKRLCLQACKELRGSTCKALHALCDHYLRQGQKRLSEACLTLELDLCGTC